MRKLKADKASKDEVMAAVQVLQSLKSEYKQATGLDYNPESKPAASAASTPAKATAPPAAATGGSNPIVAWEKVQAQGEKVRNLWQ